MTVDKHPSQVRQMFGRIAPRYDLLNHLLSMNIDRYWRWRTVRDVPPPAGREPMLDVCTGTGDLALAYRRASGGQAPVTGADFCHEMLTRAREKAGQRNEGAGIHFLEADAQQLPFPDHAFALVTVAFGLRNVSDTDRGLAEMVRVCRPGGRVAVLEFSLPTIRPVRAAYSWYFRHVLPWVGRALVRNERGAYNYLPTSVGEFPSGEQLVERMRKAGLESLRFRPLTLGVATLYVGTKPFGESQ